MNKTDLKKKWSKYCDTDKLVDDVISLLKKYGHRNSVHGVCTLLDTYFQQKAPMIEMFMKSKNYIGNMRISFEKEFERGMDKNAIYSFCSSFPTKIRAEQMMSTVDTDGKTMIDYLVAGKNVFDISSLPKENAQSEVLAKIRRFKYDMNITIDSYMRYSEFVAYIWHFQRTYSSTLPNDFTADRSKVDIPMLKAGTKTSRAFNKVCSYYGVDKFNSEEVFVEKDGEIVKKTIYPYDKMFAEYADLVSSLTRKMSFVISLNPLDYFTMSHGVSWHSCHNISNGGWKGGTMSYMLDPSSIVTFVVENLNEPIHESPKYYRQMFHYNNNLFIQNRLYPQGNDGATDLYKKFRDFMIEEFTDVLGVEGEWKAYSGTRVCTDHIRDDRGVHYKDYRSHNSCSIFYPLAKEETAITQTVEIGHDGICVDCGAIYSRSGRLNHQFKSECVK